MESKVSGFLKEGLAPEIQDAFLAPALFRAVDVIMPLIGEINKAHVIMLGECGILSGEDVAALLQTIIEIEKEGFDSIPLDPAREEHYFNYEAVVIAKLGSDTGGRMHVARSRNDMKSTQDRMRARALAIRLISNTIDLREALLESARRYVDIVMPGYTHMQPAQPSSYGWYLLGVESALRRDTARLLDSYSRINQCPLGAGAVAGTSFPIDRKRTSDLLGFECPAYHAQDAVASRDGIMELLSAVALLTTTVGRMGQDFYNMTTYEFGTLNLPDSVATTSSIMPQKKNMGPLENLKARPALVTGALVTALASQRAIPFTHTQESSNDCMRWTWDALEEADKGLVAARVIVEAAEPKPERMLELVQNNFSAVTDLADTLVRVAGLSFREAHHVVGRTVRLAQERGLKSYEIDANLLSDAAEATIGKRIQLTAQQVKDALDPTMIVNARTGSGGPSVADCGTIADQAQAQLSQDKQALADSAAKITSAKAELDARVNSLIRRRESAAK